MGSFSFCYCDTGIIETVNYGDYIGVYPTDEQRLITDDEEHPASVLLPKEFGGRKAQINVSEYEDYGHFTKEGITYDIYDLVADWNREWIAKHPNWIRPSDIRHEENGEAEPISKKEWYPFYSDLSLSKEEVMKKWREAIPKNPNYSIHLEYRHIGIDIACYDDDNAALPYPIKIARHKDSIYECCPPSYSDPYQGFEEAY